LRHFELWNHTCAKGEHIVARPYYAKQQLADAIVFLETGRPDKARRLLQITLDVLTGNRRDDELAAEEELNMLRMAK
jgi:hypothetical protein